MKTVYIEAIEPIDPTSPEAELYGQLRVRLSNGSYLGGVTAILDKPTAENQLREVSLRVLLPAPA